MWHSCLAPSVERQKEDRSKEEGQWRNTQKREKEHVKERRKKKVRPKLKKGKGDVDKNKLKSLVFHSYCVSIISPTKFCTQVIFYFADIN